MSSSQVRARRPRFDLRALRPVLPLLGLNSREILAGLLSVIAVALTVAYYFTSLKPEQEKLNSLKAEYDKQIKVLVAGKTGTGPGHVAVDSGRTSLESLETFNAKHLKSLSKGRIELIDEVNELAKKNGVTLTNGINMTLDTGADQLKAEKSSKGQSSKKKIADMIAGAFPHLEVTMTVFGPYPNLRNFITELERSKQFLIVNSLGLTNQQEATAGRGSRGGAGLSLSISLSAYFRPDGSNAPVSQN
jgi:Type II secretion system (T2SS), protein M subtype b